MTRYFVCFLLSTCLLSATTAEGQGSGWWDSGWLDWLSSWFVAPPISTTGSATLAGDECDHTPPPIRTATLPVRTVEPIRSAWPVDGSDAVASVHRAVRLARTSVLVADDLRRLPLSTTTGVRLVYQAGHRPDQLIDMARRFGNVQPVAFSTKLSPAFSAASDVPLLVVVENPAGRPSQTAWYESLYGTDKVILLHYGDFTQLRPVPETWTVLHCPLRSEEGESLLAQAVYGAQSLASTLKVGNEQYTAGTGRVLTANRGGFRQPEQVGIDRVLLGSVDDELHRAIRLGAMPGAQLAILKDGQLIYERAYGKQQRRGQPVTPGDLYDLASVTKAAATTLAAMKLYDEGRLRLDATVADYLPQYLNTPLGKYTIAALLSHHTGLQAQLPLAQFLPEIKPTSQVADGDIWLSDTRAVPEDVPQRLAAALANVDYTRQPIHRYSDVNFVLLQYVVEAIAGTQVDTFLEQHFYAPMGLQRLTYRPRQNFPQEQLVPSSQDRWLGRGHLRGYVHDEGAAMMGGVAGHAGLFGNAADVGRLFQLLLDGGTFADESLLSAATVQRFTDGNPYNQRALGFDRLRKRYRSVVAAGASERTFGHTGFTGTSVWADPDNQLVVVLLTNRTYPNHDNSRLQRLGTRGRVHRAVYRALDTYPTAGDEVLASR